MIEPIRWTDGTLQLLDQRRLPAEHEYLDLSEPDAVAAAIRDLVVRGAPAIGVTAAYGLVLGARDLPDDPALFVERFADLCERMRSARPTAVNLAWAVERMQRRVEATVAESVEATRAALLQEANAIMAEDLAGNRAMGRFGAELLPERSRLLTHCNAGALATAGYGTALGVVRAAVEAGKQVHLFADETRPFLQGARLTAWEMVQEGIPCTVITDGMAGHLMKTGEIDAVVVGSDRIAANGDVANKIGTYPLAVLAREHSLPFYVAAPTSTVDLGVATGDEIPIEQRDADEVLILNDARIAPAGVHAAYPAFDVTPARLVTAIITEKGVARPPFEASLRAQFED